MNWRTSPSDASDAHVLFIDADVRLWKEETQIIAKELLLFTSLLAVRLHELSKTRNANFSGLFDALAQMERENPVFQEQIAQYLIKRQALNECDDLQCETFFVKGHMAFKQAVETHLARYRQLKGDLLEALSHTP